MLCAHLPLPAAACRIAWHPSDCCGELELCVDVAESKAQCLCLEGVAGDGKGGGGDECEELLRVLCGSGNTSPSDRFLDAALCGVRGEHLAAGAGGVRCAGFLGDRELGLDDDKDEEAEKAWNWEQNGSISSVGVVRSVSMSREPKASWWTLSWFEPGDSSSWPSSAACVSAASAWTSYETDCARSSCLCAWRWRRFGVCA